MSTVHRNVKGANNFTWRLSMEALAITFLNHHVALLAFRNGVIDPNHRFHINNKNLKTFIKILRR